MAKKQKVEKMKRPSKEAVRRRFEERILTQEGKRFGEASDNLHRLPTGEYALPHIQERWKGFLLAYDRDANELLIPEATPYVFELLRDMRAVAQEIRDSGQSLELAALIEKWTDAIETNPDGIYEDVYSLVVETIDPLVRMGHLPGSVGESVVVLVEHFTASQHARDITPAASGTKALAGGTSMKHIPMLQ